ncbi:MAG: CARDB domain-containing protein [Caldilineaceae bacterium]
MPTHAPSTPDRRRPFALRTLLALAVMCFLFIAFAFAVMPQASAAPEAETAAGPDLTVEISMDPPVPSLGQQVDITYIVRNVGTSATNANTIAYLWVDPRDVPPKPGITPLGYPFQIPSLPAGGSAQITRQHTFTEQGCAHAIYALADGGNVVIEDNEDNNLVSLPLCVGVECEPDEYDVSASVNDNQCSVGTPIFEGQPQAHTFCHATNQNDTDTDWVKFTAFQGVTYTLGTSNWQTFANPQIVIRSACNGADLVSGERAVTWQPPVAGIYYARLQNDPALQGPLTAFSLTMTATTGITDNYEPDDICGQARDITTDGVKQSHRFQSPGDNDWIKFGTSSGESFVLLIDNTGTDVSPQVSVFAGCSQARAATDAITGTTQVVARSTQDQVYYARITNQDPDRYGADATYDVGVVATQCADDPFEDDDALAQAKDLTIGAAQTHNTCPAGDQDWVKFELTAGNTYVIQTSDLDFAADTVLDLYSADGTLLATNDDYNYVDASRIVFEPSTTGVYYARVTHHQPTAAGVNTGYDIVVTTGFCAPDLGDASSGDNAPAGAPTLPTNGTPQPRNFCADPQNVGLGDQDWVRFDAVAGGNYQIGTGGLGANTDPVLKLYARRRDIAGQQRRRRPRP